MALIVLGLAILARSASSVDSSWIDAEATELAFLPGAEGQILLPASADGVDVGPCLLDSGAEAKMMAITPTAARRAELKVLARLPWSIAKGIYGSTGFVLNRTAEEFRVGPVLLRQPRLVELPDLEALFAGTPRVGSLCSSAIFQAAIVDIDWRAHRISFYRPAIMPEGLESIKWVPLVEHDGLQHVRLTVEDDHEGLFIIDTGMTAAIHFHAHVVEKHRMLADRTVRTTVGRGIGGSATVLEGRIQGLTLSHYRVGALTGIFDTVERHRRNDQVSGSIGIGLLQHFRTIIDMPNGRVAFIAHEQGSRSAGSHDLMN